MNTLDSARYLMRAYPGGAESLAPRLNKDESTLRHEVAGHAKYKLGIVDAEAMTQMALEARVPNAMAILHAMAANCGAMIIALPDRNMPDETTFADLASAAKEFADFVSVSANAVADGRVTGNELRDVDRELAQLIACAHKVRSGLAAIHAAEQTQREMAA